MYTHLADNIRKNVGPYCNGNMSGHMADSHRNLTMRCNQVLEKDILYREANKRPVEYTSDVMKRNSVFPDRPTNQINNQVRETPNWLPARAFNYLQTDLSNYNGITPVRSTNFRNPGDFTHPVYRLAGVDNIRDARIALLNRSKANQVQSTFNQLCITQPNIHSITQFINTK